MIKKIGILLFLAASVGAGHAVPLQGLPLLSDMAFADSYTQDGKPCPPECVSDTMEIVTWYPSPYNEYEELRLYPISESNSPNGECGQDNRGLMYYDKDVDKVYICKGAIEGWKELGGSGNLPQSTTSISFCDLNNLGKLIYDTTRNRPYVCALNGSSYVWKPLDSDYDEDGVTDAVDANDTDFNDATAVEANVETGKTFYARGGSRKTGSLVVSDVGGVCVTAVNTASYQIICNAQTLERIWTWKYYLQSSAGNASARPYTADEYCEIDSWNRSWGYMYRSSPCSCPTGYTSILIFATDYVGGGRHEVYYCKKN